MVIQVADAILRWSEGKLYRDLEHRADWSGKVANLLNWGLFGITGSINTAIFASKTFSFGIDPRLPGLAQLIAIPSTGVFLGLGCIQGALELSHLYKTQLLYKRLQKQGDSLEKLQWIRDRYFSLREKDTIKIQQWIGTTMPTLSTEEKALKFEEIADKILANRFAALQNRITPTLANKVGEEIGPIMRDLGSFYPSVREGAELRAEMLMKSVSKQARRKMITHLIGLAAVTFTLIGLIAFLVGVSGGGFFIAMGAISIALYAVRILIDKGVLAKEADQFDKMVKLMLPEEDDLMHRLKKLIAL